MGSLDTCGSVFAYRAGSKPLDTLLYAPDHGINTPQSNYILSQAEKSKYTVSVIMKAKAQLCN